MRHREALHACQEPLICTVLFYGCRQQDENLTDIERGVENVTNMGKQIHEHIKEDVSVYAGQPTPAEFLMW